MRERNIYRSFVKRHTADNILKVGVINNSGKIIKSGIINEKFSIYPNI